MSRFQALIQRPPRSFGLSPVASRIAVLAASGLAAALASCSAQESAGPPCSSASCLDLTLPAVYQPLERPAARFEHQTHVQALGTKHCDACHEGPRNGNFGLRGVLPTPETSRAAVIDQVHALCIGCHQERQSAGQPAGPQLCGACHRGAHAASPAQAPVRMDLSLHQRHVAAHDEKCETCHHVVDPASNKLVYRKGEESGCRDCHGATDSGRSLAWRTAAHDACVGCHGVGEASGEKSGPTDCTGCHEPAKLAAVERLNPVPRLDRGQAAWIWMRAPWATSATVLFPHEKHEAAATACSDCHHNTLKKCGACHTAEGRSEGGGVTLQTAFHDARSPRSCVGCHESIAASSRECAGCHDGTKRSGTRERCAVCHAAGEHERATAAKNPQDKPATLKPLPASQELPDKDVLIKEMARLYAPATLPHPAIVARLDTAVRNSALGTRFHEHADTLCEGCHHHEAQRANASRCTSCHGTQDGASRDMPSAVQAYHRQCTGCHERMQIGAAGCTDCHAQAEGMQ